MQNIKISLNQTSKLQNITLTGALSPDRLASSVDVIAVMLYCLVMDNSSDAIDVGDVREEFPLGPLSVAERLFQTGAYASPLSLFSFEFKVLMWMASKIFLGKSLGSLSDTFTFSQSLLCPLLRSTCSLITDLEQTALDLCSDEVVHH